MITQEEECPKCFGIVEVMEPLKKKGFKYKTCTLCKGKGTVPKELADDYVFSLNEDNFETNDDW
jgi:hypothetical protein